MKKIPIPEKYRFLIKGNKVAFSLKVNNVLKTMTKIKNKYENHTYNRSKQWINENRQSFKRRLNTRNNYSRV